MGEFAVEVDADFVAVRFECPDGCSDEVVVLFEAFGCWWLRDGFTVGLAYVEHADFPEAGEDLLFWVVGVFAEHWGEDAYAPFAFADLPAHFLPFAVATDEYGCWQLGEDQEAVEEAVGVELSSELQGFDPAFAGEQVEHCGLQAFQGGLVG